MEDINRFVVVPPENTPSHINVAQIFTTHSRACSFAAQTRGRVLPAIDADALMAYQERERSVAPADEG